MLQNMTTEIKYDTIFQIKNMLRNKSMIDGFYQNNENGFSKFLLSILNDSTYDLNARAEIAWNELYKIVNKADDSGDSSILIDNKMELQRVLLNCFETKLRDAHEFDMNLFGFYSKNLESIAPGTRKIEITEDANKLMRKFILNHSYNYLKKFFLREHPEPSFDGRHFQLDPFLPYYFDNDWDEIENILKSEEIKSQFRKEVDGLLFHEFLLEAFKIARNTSRDFFEIKDRTKIDLAEKFISIIHSPRGIELH
jgi:hypothetical protein